MAKDKVLVTGAAGFIGSHVAKHVAALGHSVVGLDDLSGGYEENVPKTVDFVCGSILDTSLLERLFQKYRFGVVFHLAAYAAEGLSHFARSFNYTNNVLGSIGLISSCIRHGCKRFVFTSSIAVYGSNQVPMTEDLAPRPEDPYGIAKCCVEQDLAAMHHLFGIDYTIFRPHNVYGEFQNIGDPFRNVIGIFMRQILQGQALTIFGGGQQTRAFSYIDDVAPIIARSAWENRAANEIFNIGADQPTRVIDLAKEVTRAMGVQARVTHLEPRWEVQHAWANHDKVQRIFGTAPSTPLQTGLEQMARWVQMTGVRESRRLPPVEIWKNLPPSWMPVLEGSGQLSGKRPR